MLPYNPIQGIQEQFPIFRKRVHGYPLLYLDHAATSQKPSVVIDAMSDFYRNEYGTVHRAVYSLSAHATKRHQEVRRRVQKFLHAAQEEEVIFTRGTTESINLIAASFRESGLIGPGDEIVITEMEHHANIVPWQMLCRRTGAALRIAPVREDAVLDRAAFSALINSKTKIVAIAHVANTTGIRNPLRELIQEAHAAGAWVLVDGAQAAPHEQIDMQDLDADFYVFSGHKVYGPTGIGILYGKRVLLEMLPPCQGGGDMIETVSWEGTTYRPAPLKFEAGTPMIAEVIGLGAALAFIESIGIDAIQAWEQELLAYAAPRLAQIPGLQILGNSPQKAAILSFFFSDLHPLDIGSFLDSRGIAIRTGHQCAQPILRRFGLASACRISFGIYNTKEEVDRFCTALDEICARLRRS